MADQVERNNGGVRKGFYTVSEAAKVLGVGQRRILQMLETKEIEGERDPISGRWKIAKHAVHKLAPEEPTDTKEPLLAEKPAVSEKDTAELRVSKESQATERPDAEKQLLANELSQNDLTETSSGQSLEELRERIGELEHLNEHLQLEQQAEKASWQEEKEALFAAADRERKHAETLQEEVERLGAELATLRERMGELESVNEDLQREQQAEKAAWQEEKRSLLAAANRDREHAEALQKEVQRLGTELEAERSKGFWRRVFGG